MTPKKYPQNLHTPKKYSFFWKPKKILKFRILNPKNWAEPTAYVCVKILEYPPCYYQGERICQFVQIYNLVLQWVIEVTLIVGRKGHINSHDWRLQGMGLYFLLKKSLYNFRLFRHWTKCIANLRIPILSLAALVNIGILRSTLHYVQCFSSQQLFWLYNF